MADDKKYYWIKLKTDFFNTDEIDWLLEQENGCAYVVLYQKLCILTANNGGELSRRIGEMIIPYEPRKIAEVTRFDVDTVVVAMGLYKRLGLIYEHENGFLRISGFESLVGSETKWAEKKRLQKANNAPLEHCRRLNAETIMLPDGTKKYVDEKRYGGHGMQAYDRARGQCEVCGSTEGLLIHHKNGYSNEIDDLIVLCTACHGKAHSHAGLDEDGGDVGGNIPPEVPQSVPPIVPPNFREEIEIRDRDRDRVLEIDSEKEPEKKKKRKAPATAAASPDFSGTTFTPAMVTKVEEWLQYKKERRDAYQPTGLKALISEIQNNVNRYGEQPVMDLITTCMARGYQGIIFDKLRGLPEVGQQTGRAAAIPDTNNIFARRAMERRFGDV